MSCNCANKELCGCIYSTLSFIYQGEELSCIDIPTGMSLEAILTQINSKFCELVTTVTNINTSNYTLGLNVNDLILANDGNTVSAIDISKFLDNLNLARIASHNIDSQAKIINLVRDDNTIIPIDISTMFSVENNTTNNSVVITGDTTKIITINDSEGNNIQGTFIDNNTTNTNLTVTGDTTKTITLTDSDNNSVSATFEDNVGASLQETVTNLRSSTGINEPNSIIYTNEENSDTVISVGNLIPLPNPTGIQSDFALGIKGGSFPVGVENGVNSVDLQMQRGIANNNDEILPGHRGSVGSVSFTSGDGTKAVGRASAAFNQETEVEMAASCASAFGYRTINNIPYSMVIGRLNENIPRVNVGGGGANLNDPAFVVGAGSIGNNPQGRSDAFRVYYSGFMKLKPTSQPTIQEEGMIYFDNVTKKLRCYDGTTWQDLF